MTERPIRLLLVDDDEETYLLVRHLLAQSQDQQIELDWASTYEAGLEAIAQDRHDLYLVDYRLNAHDGLELLRQAVRGGCQRPIIMLTGLGDRSLDLQAMRAGAADYLVKDRLDGTTLERAIRYALERQRLLEALRNQAQQLRRLAAQLGGAEERERRRIALLLHDEIQQILVAIKMQLDILQHRPADRQEEVIAAAQRLLDEALEGCRTLAVEISPPVLHQMGLVAALDWLGRWMHWKYDLKVDLRIEGEVEPDSESLRLFLFRAVRELLFNVVKHAQTDQVQLNVRRAPQDRLRIIVEDGGIGFDPDQIGQAQQPDVSSPRLGLFHLRERLRAMHGQMEVLSQPGQGTRVVLQIPLRVVYPLLQPDSASL